MFACIYNLNSPIKAHPHKTCKCLAFTCRSCIQRSHSIDHQCLRSCSRGKRKDIGFDRILSSWSLSSRLCNFKSQNHKSDKEGRSFHIYSSLIFHMCHCHRCQHTSRSEDTRDFVCRIECISFN